MYNYPYTEKNGYVRFRVSRKIKKEVLGKNYSKRFKKHYFLYNKNRDVFIIEKHISYLGAFLILMLFPIALLLEGLSNYKNVWNDTKNCFPYFARKNGSFSTITILESDRNNDYKILKEHYQTRKS